MDYSSASLQNNMTEQQLVERYGDEWSFATVYRLNKAFSTGLLQKIARYGYVVDENDTRFVLHVKVLELDMDGEVKALVTLQELTENNGTVSKRTMLDDVFSAEGGYNRKESYLSTPAVGLQRIGEKVSRNLSRMIYNHQMPKKDR